MTCNDVIQSNLKVPATLAATAFVPMSALWIPHSVTCWMKSRCVCFCGVACAFVIEILRLQDIIMEYRHKWIAERSEMYRDRRKGALQGMLLFTTWLNTNAEVPIHLIHTADAGRANVGGMTFVVVASPHLNQLVLLFIHHTSGTLSSATSRSSEGLLEWIVVTTIQLHIHRFARFSVFLGFDSELVGPGNIPIIEALVSTERCSKMFALKLFTSRVYKAAAALVSSRINHRPLGIQVQHIHCPPNADGTLHELLTRKNQLSERFPTVTCHMRAPARPPVY